MDTNRRDRILVADHNPIFRETLAWRLRAAGYEVTTADTGEHAFLALRDWQHPVDWLYASAGLPILIDGWILADEYHDTCPTRPVVIAAQQVRPSQNGDIILAQPSPASVLEIIRELIAASHVLPAVTEVDPNISGMQRNNRAPAVSPTVPSEGCFGDLSALEEHDNDEQERALVLRGQLWHAASQCGAPQFRRQ
ncbi:response regulator [Microvirga lotononidis]|uniref:Response regulatory domain-containing protein n=1 Tax=Microvirga lotononidis TaxID=864069 RepID=I4YKK3_9HYPH|nr:response regulator [Microvirga lotononidis]EIM24495.1 hypothetical protein MicloDRAFT_00052070 [Microvirga lotononidis]WQO26520.1 response regulator [Microvirga lotononidis]